MSDKCEYPVLDAWRTPDGLGLQAWCVYERCWHHHGARAGHRVAHCIADTPYRKTGYIVAEVPGPRPSNSEAAILGAIQRGYLIVHGRAPTLITAYWQQVREWGVCAVILELRARTATLTWNGDAVDERGTHEAFAPAERQVERRYLTNKQVDRATSDALHDLLIPYMERARNRRVVGMPNLWYGGLYGFNREDGEAVAEQVATFIKRICPPPESRAAFYDRLDAAVRAN